MRLTARLAALLFCVAAHAAERPPAAFEFVAIGDVPYHLPADWQRLENLIAAINRVQPAFTVHVGDINSGRTQATNEHFEKIAGYFATFDHPLFYTPGDNEWADTWQPARGGFDALERLATLRRMFFPKDQSLGRRPMPLTSQRGDPAHATYVENVRWTLGGVVFATAHVIGSNNNDKPAQAALHAEYLKRDAANTAWIRASFAEATRSGARAFVLCIQAGPFPEDSATKRDAPQSGFVNFLRVLTEETLKFDRPVLLVHGDQHRFVIDKVLRNPANKRIIEKFTRLQVFGDRDMHAVRITVDPKAPEIFSFRTMMIEKNLQTHAPAAP